MEAMGAEGQWTSLSGVYTAEEADFMALLLNNQISSTTLQNFWPTHQDNYPMTTNYCSLELPSPNNIYTTFSRGSTSPSNTKDNYNNTNNNYSYGGSFTVFPTSSNDLSDQNSQPTSIDFFVGEAKTAINDRNSSYLVHGDSCDVRLSSEEISNNGGEAVEPKMIKQLHSAKRPRNTDENVVEAVVGKRQAKSRKKPKLVVSIPGYQRNNANEDGHYGAGAINNGASTSSASGDESINGGQESPDSSSLSPKDHSNLSSDAKARARRGSATDPQSLYARKRRERINERLRILQNLVPNGTKVDISTMLEEAVQYVKFLQIQIKLLSSDDLWMYAPIAYNGKELGLDHNLKLSLAKQS